MALWLVSGPGAMAAPKAAIVMDARTGRVLYSDNADTPLHPASLTKMMTLYIAFEAVQHGEISMDTLVTISKNASAEPASKLWMSPGQKIKLRYLVRAAAVKSANDAATAIGEAISGSEEAFAQRMNRTAKALGMTQTHFRNANGLTQSGHKSSARDMAILGRHMIYDYPMYYNLFSRRSTSAGSKTVYNTNRKFLAAYRGADGIKTGYTSAAGFNLVGSAERGSVRIVASVFGESSVAARNARMARLLDLGFDKAPGRVALRRPALPPYLGKLGDERRLASATTEHGYGARTVRTVKASVQRSLKPRKRPGSGTTVPAPQALPEPMLMASLAEDISAALVTLEGTTSLAEEAEGDIDDGAEIALASAAAAFAGIRPQARPLSAAAPAPVAVPDTRAEAPIDLPAPEVTEAETQIALLPTPEVAPAVAPKPAVQNAPTRQIVVRPRAPVEYKAPRPALPAAPAQLVTRIGAEGDPVWGITLGRFPTRASAETLLVQVAMTEAKMLRGANTSVVSGSRGFDAQFSGLTREAADLACRRLQARQMTCFMVGPT